MGHVALYRQYRPATFDDVVAQKHAVAALQQSVISGHFAHAYLFCGTRGTGKTSIAKIFSRAMNCLNPQNGNPCNQCEICRGILDNTLLDVIEMDAASNNSVDNIRRICDEVMFLPSLAKYKVYIIDEVHMLSSGAFNALLKTLEEPPAHAVFLLATTEPHRIPATIISRCQRYDFRRIPLEDMIARLRSISDTQKIHIDDEALFTIASLSDGALRDAISLLDQVSSDVNDHITRDDILKITGVVDDAFLFSMAEALLYSKSSELIRLSEQLVMDGRDIIHFTLDLAHYFRDLMVIRVSDEPSLLVSATSESMRGMRSLSAQVSEDVLIDVITMLSELVAQLKWSPDIRTSFEIALLSYTIPNGPSRLNGNLALPPITKPASSSVSLKSDKSIPSSSPAPAVPSVALSAQESSVADSSVVAPGVSSPTDDAAPSVAAIPAIAEPAVATPTVLSPVAKSPDEPDDLDAPPPPEPPEDGFGYDQVPAFFQENSEVRQETTSTPPLPSDISTLGQSNGVPELNKMTTNISRVATAHSTSRSGKSGKNTSAKDSYMPPPLLTLFSPNAAKVVDPPNPYQSRGIRPAPPINMPSEGDKSEQTSELSGAASDLSSPAFVATAQASTLPVIEQWQIVLHHWQDTLFSDYLQFKNAVIQRDGNVFHIVLPNNTKDYIDKLTARGDYKKMIADIKSIVVGVETIEITTVSQSDPLSAHPSNASSEEPASAKPAWVSQILSLSQDPDIEIIMTDSE